MIILSIPIIYWFEKNFGFLMSVINKISKDQLASYGADYLLNKQEDNCFKCYDRMLKLYKNHAKIYPNLLYAYGMACYHFGSFYAKAIKLFEELLDNKLCTDPDIIMSVNQILGTFYGELGNFESAFKYFGNNATDNAYNTNYTAWLATICFASQF